MGNGLPPGPRTGLHDAGEIDDGTLARIGSPTPGSIGVGAQSGEARTLSPKTSNLIVSFARRHMGVRVGNGECFTLVDRALRNAGAKSAADFGPVGPDENYIWGTSINLSELRPGDVIQFRDYACTHRVDTETDKGTAWQERREERGHHTAIVQQVGGNGAVTVLEQNSPKGSPVVRTELFFADGRITSRHRTATITVEGTFWFYRPHPR